MVEKWLVMVSGVASGIQRFASGLESSVQANESARSSAVRVDSTT